MESMKTKRVLGAVGVLIAIAAGINASGCKLLKKVAKSQKYGAIAFDEKTGGWGYSYDKLGEEAAKSAATKKCTTCTVRLTWQKGCGALAQSTTKKEIMTTGTGFNRPAAETAAKAECTSKGGETCKVVVWACNSSK